MGKRRSAAAAADGASSASSAAPKRARAGDSSDDEAAPDADVPAQWEFDFGDEQPDAQGLLEMAIDEKSDGNSEAAVRLFELALEAFAKEAEKALQGAKEEVQQFRYSWASCLRELGEYLPLREYLDDAALKLTELTAETSGPLGLDVAASLGRTRLALAQLLREQALEVDERRQDEDADDDERARQATEARTLRSSAEQALKQGVEAYEKAIATIPSKMTGRAASEHSLLARYLTNYATVADAAERGALLDQALVHTRLAMSLKPKDDFVLSVHSATLQALAKLLAGQDKREQALSTANEAAATFEKALAGVDAEERHVDTVKGLADTYVLLTTLDSDEDKVMSYFDKARALLKEALQLSPDFAEAREQLELLGGDADSDADGESDQEQASSSEE